MGKEFLGTGLAFPLEVDATGELALATEEAKVQQSLLVILGTARGERVMRPDFGSRLHELVFEPTTATTRGRVAQYVTEAIATWEPRVELQRVQVREDRVRPNRLLVDIDYRVKATNSRFNLVYPFYLQESGNGRSDAR